MWKPPSKPLEVRPSGEEEETTSKPYAWHPWESSYKEPSYYRRSSQSRSYSAAAPAEEEPERASPSSHSQSTRQVRPSPKAPIIERQYSQALRDAILGKVWYCENRDSQGFPWPFCLVCNRWVDDSHLGSKGHSKRMEWVHLWMESIPRPEDFTIDDFRDLHFSSQDFEGLLDRFLEGLPQFRANMNENDRGNEIKPHQLNKHSGGLAREKQTTKTKSKLAKPSVPVPEPLLLELMSGDENDEDSYEDDDSIQEDQIPILVLRDFQSDVENVLTVRQGTTLWTYQSVLDITEDLEWLLVMTPDDEEGYVPRHVVTKFDDE